MICVLVIGNLIISSILAVGLSNCCGALLQLQYFEEDEEAEIGEEDEEDTIHSAVEKWKRSG